MMIRSGLYTDPDNGNLAIITPTPSVVNRVMSANRFTEEEAMMVMLDRASPPGITPELVDAIDIPTDSTFREAWEHDTSPSPEKVRINLNKAKSIAHNARRLARKEAFRPHDELTGLAATIASSGVAVPAQIATAAASAEVARATIRANDAAKQAAIDSAATIAELKTALSMDV